MGLGGLREQFSAVQPGYHMNKKHWNTVLVNNDVDDPTLMKFIDKSYKLVVDKLPKKVRDEMQIG